MFKLKLCADKQLCQRMRFILTQSSWECWSQAEVRRFQRPRPNALFTCAEKQVCRIKAQHIDFFSLSFPFLISWCHYLAHKMANQYHICIVFKAERKGRRRLFSRGALYITHTASTACPDKLRWCIRSSLIKALAAGDWDVETVRHLPFLNI